MNKNKLKRAIDILNRVANDSDTGTFASEEISSAVEILRELKVTDK